MHPMAARMPQECVAVFTMCFMSEQLQVQFNVPSYQAWLDEQDMRPTYEFYKRFLQHMLSGGVRGERLVLKSPAHLQLLDTLRELHETFTDEFKDLGPQSQLQGYRHLAHLLSYGFELYLESDPLRPSFLPLASGGDHAR